MKDFNWEDYWGGMPTFVSDDHKSYYVLRINRRGAKAYDGKQAFVTIHFYQEGLEEYLTEVSEKLGQIVSSKMREIEMEASEQDISDRLFGKGVHAIGHHSCWYPWKDNIHHIRYVYRQENERVVNPEYPVYVISKGRWESPLLTARALERMGVSYTLVVEPQERKKYEAAFKDGYDDGVPYKWGTLLTAPDNFSKQGRGSIPVRNYVWDLAIKTGKDRHWLMDDNIPTFNRTNYNHGIRVQTGAIFRAIEVFADRYENIAITGLQNSQFVLSKWKWPAFFLNTRVYSCTLIKNDLDLSIPNHNPPCPEKHWRGRYNEDTDLCIRALKKGWCTVLFVTFNADKVGTMVMKGGNTDKLYAGDGRARMAESLHKQHPDEVRVGHRWNRAQHIVNYSACVKIGKDAIEDGCVLKRRKDIKVPDRDRRDEFGMVLYNKETGKPTMIDEFFKEKESVMEKDRKEKIVKEKRCDWCQQSYKADRGHKHRDHKCSPSQVAFSSDSSLKTSFTMPLAQQESKHTRKEAAGAAFRAEVEDRLAPERLRIEAEVLKEFFGQ